MLSEDTPWVQQVREAVALQIPSLKPCLNVVPRNQHIQAFTRANNNADNDSRLYGIDNSANPHGRMGMKHPFSVSSFSNDILQQLGSHSMMPSGYQTSSLKNYSARNVEILPYKKRSRKKAEEDRVCSNCGSVETPFWRKEKDSGKSLCNACGLFASKNNYSRPSKLWKADKE